jgi:formate hydrogenlyase subunit 6/NADH:ubiquinone oxidoreductase subunit I
MKTAPKKSFIKNKEIRMTNLTFFEKRHVPIYDDPSQIEFGIVAFDYGKCVSCGMCVKVCPASTLEMVNKKPRMTKILECMMCSDCVAVCPEGAITATRNYRYTGRYKTIGFGNLQMPRL